MIQKKVHKKVSVQASKQASSDPIDKGMWTVPSITRLTENGNGAIRAKLAYAPFESITTSGIDS